MNIKIGTHDHDGDLIVGITPEAVICQSRTGNMDLIIIKNIDEYENQEEEMGYYTNHKLQIVDNRSSLSYDEVKQKTISKLTKLNIIDYALDEYLECCESVKWYDHKDDMNALSKEVKDVLFLLEGEGEESGDIWKEYWLNGKCQRCEVRLEFDAFDEKKLEAYGVT